MNFDGLNRGAAPSLWGAGLSRPHGEPGDEELVEREEWHRLILGSTSDLISTHAVDTTFVFVSGACQRLFGWEPEELLGRRVLDIIHPDDLDLGRRVHQRLLDSSDVENFIGRLQRKDGSYVWVESLIRVMNRGGDSGGQPMYRVAVTRDVSAQQQARERQDRLRQELEQAAFEWRSTFDAIQTPLLMLGFDGRLRRLNRAARELLGRPYRDLIGLPLSELGSDQPSEAIAALAHRVMEGFSSEVCEARDDTGRIWEVEACASTGSEAGGANVIVQVRDITETARLQESLRRSETMAVLGAVVGGVAHEVRNPLFGMSSLLDAFEARFGDRPELDAYLPKLRVELGRMIDLMQALLDYGKPARFELAPGCVTEPLRNALEICSPLAARQQVRLASEDSAGNCPVLLDAARLTQAFKNLIENAVQHSPADSQVLVEAFPVTLDGVPWVRVSVRDRGPGFNPADLPKILEPFFSRRKGGTGLGLSIVARVVEGHGGRLRTANRPDGGAAVEIDIPCIRIPESC